MLGFLLKPAVLVPLLVGFFGCLAIFNASCSSSRPFHLVRLQLVWLALGFGLLMLALHMSVQSLLRWLPMIAVLPIGLIYMSSFASIFFVGGVRGTMVLIPGTELVLEPAVLFLPLYVVWLARFAPGQNHEVPLPWRSFWLYFLLASLWWLPIAFIPNVGLMLLYVLAFVIVYWLQSGRVLQILSGLLILALAVSILMAADPGLRKKAVEQIGNGDCWVTNSALANGGLSGSDPEAATWTQTYLNEQDKQRSFLGLAESLGFIGLVPIFAGLAVAAYLGISRSMKRRLLAESLIFVGLTTLLIVQVLLHLSAIAGLLPDMNLRLPIFGYGGSTLIAAMFSIGILIHFSTPQPIEYAPSTNTESQI